MEFFLRVIISAFVIAGVAELAKRYSVFAAILASLPLTSILAMTWLYLETRDVQAVNRLAGSIFWAVLPSLIFFLTLPLLLRVGLKFAPAMLLSITIMALAYSLYVALMLRFGVEL